uniref:hypothetical protein n=1 Tax=Salmonella sp. TaxID=599 RepID=UPI001CD9861D|nr:hypothetical protein [Salmonella sp.]
MRYFFLNGAQSCSFGYAPVLAVFLALSATFSVVFLSVTDSLFSGVRVGGFHFLARNHFAILLFFSQLYLFEPIDVSPFFSVAVVLILFFFASRTLSTPLSF